MEKNGNILMQKYEMGRLLGQGTFAKVHYARNIMSGHSVAIKIIDKEKVMRIGLIEQIKREISVMRLVRHPNVIKLYEVMASKTKIYFALEYVKGGELFNKVAKGRLNEATSRKYFQQLIAAVDFCHSRGVYHRDLKPENLLLDEDGNLKVSDFGLSALSETRRQDGLLHTTCGTPAYVAPEVINRRGYDGAKADIWSCGVILFVLMAGYLPFHDSNLMEMYKKISRGSFRCPHWFPLEIRKLLSRILDPNPRTRMKVSAIMDNTWFKKGFKPIELPLVQDDSNRASCSNVDTAFSTSETDCSSGKKIESIPSPFSSPTKLSCFNAFHIISLSQGVDLSGLFENHFGPKLEARFTTQKPPSTILSKLEEIASRQSFDVQMKDGTIKMQGNRSGRKGQLGIDFEIFEVTPAFHVVELTKTAGDTMEYKSFCKDGLRPCLQEIVWAWQGNSQQEQPQAT